MQTTIRATLIHFGLAIIFAVLTVALTDLTTHLPIDIGWYFLTVLYVLIALGLIVFYRLTTYTKIWLTVLSFILNFVLWVAEQVNLERFFHDTFLYQDNRFRYAVIILGGLLWAFNKLIIDRLFILFKVNFTLTNRVENILTRQRN